MLLVGPPILRQCTPQIPPLPPSQPPLSTGEPPALVSHNPCTLLFFTVNPVTTPEKLRTLLNKAWEYDPLTTLRLVCYLRTLYGDLFCNAALWLYENHPLTLSCNLREFATFGSLKDFAVVLYKLVNVKSDFDIARRAVRRYVEDSTYRFLHERVSDVFADLLKTDVKSLCFGNVDLVSFASLECPSVDSSIDRNTLLCEGIAKKVFPRDSDPSYEFIKDDHYVYRVRNRLRKEVLGPLRVALQGKKPSFGRGGLQDYSTLVFMKKAYLKLIKMKEANKLNYYQIVLSMLLRRNTRVFPLTPLSVVASLNDKNAEEKELEWKRMVSGFSEEAKLVNSVAVCDVSEGMTEVSKNVSISMGLVISQLSNDIWKESIYEFNQSPKLQKIEGGNLQSKLNFIKQLVCTNKVDIEDVLLQILKLAVTKGIAADKMVERVFVFTNKDFRKGGNHSWGWNYRLVWDKYRKSGFKRVPEVVFWNIEGLNSSPPSIKDVCHNRVMIINGFSRSLFAFFLNENAVWRSDEIKSVTTAEDVMKITISGKEYQNLVVLD